MSEAFEGLLAQATPEVQELARAARALIYESYIALFRARINLGLCYGAELSDDAGPMEGVGKRLRHVKISQLAQRESPTQRASLTAASGHLPDLQT